jgi:phosphoribosylamine---glycine ligase
MSKYKFLIVSYDALATDLAWTIKKEGNEVKYFIQTEKYKDIGDGFVEKSADWRVDAEWADVIIFDDVLGHGTWAKELRDKGKLVVGGTPYTDMLEDDRSFGQNELKKAGVNILPYWEFTNFDDAIHLVKTKPSRYVIKPSGEAQNNKKLLFVGDEEDGHDVIRVLEAYKNSWSDEIKVFQLQKRATGVEVGVGAFFNGNEFVTPINVNFEHKRLFPGNLGPATGEMGTSMYWSEPNRIFQATLAKMEKKLKEEHYVGYIDVNCIVNSQGIYPLEFTSRFGYPTISIQQEGIKMPMGEFFYKMCTGELKTFPYERGFQLGLRVVVPPFPFNDQQTFDNYSKGSAILFKTDNREGIHLEDIKIHNGQWVITGNSGVVLIVTSKSTSMKTAQKQLYQRVKNIVIPSMYYRDDIGDRWYEDCDRLHSWGYLR